MNTADLIREYTKFPRVCAVAKVYPKLRNTKLSYPVTALAIDLDSPPTNALIALALRGAASELLAETGKFKALCGGPEGFTPLLLGQSVPGLWLPIAPVGSYDEALLAGLAELSP